MKLHFLLAAFLLTGSIVNAADPAAELASFSVFDKIDVNDLANGDVKTMHGPPMNGRFLSVQSVYVVPVPPAQVLQASKNWDPTKHRDLKVFLHTDLPGSPSSANFSNLKSPPSNGAVNTLIGKTEKLSTDLQISKEEAKKPAGTGLFPFWSEVLAARAKGFVSGGTAAQAPYDHTGDAIKPNEEVNSLLKQQDKIRKQFSGLLGATGIGHGAGSISPELYWELLEVDDQGVVTLGASYERGQQTADVLYYASGGYYVALTLSQMWPVTVNGKPATLVWRGDMISSASLAELHGVERLGSESAMMKDISKAITVFRKGLSR